MRFNLKLGGGILPEESIKDAVTIKCSELRGIGEDERAEMIEQVIDETRKIASKWLRTGHTVTLIIDTRRKSCTFKSWLFEEEVAV